MPLARSELEINLNCAEPCVEVQPMAIISVLGMRNRDEVELFCQARTSDTEWIKFLSKEVEKG
jgi:hypothetical protein